MEEIIKKIIKSSFLEKLVLRRAFLRGIFAAEGNVGIAHLEKKPYITQITFSIALKEEYLRKLICKALKLEKIIYKIDKNHKDNSLNIRISNWKHYFIFWKIKIFEICKRKKRSFEKITKKLDIYLKFRKKFQAER